MPEQFDLTIQNMFTVKNGFKFGLGLSLAWVLVSTINRSRALTEKVQKIDDELKAKLDSSQN